MPYITILGGNMISPLEVVLVSIITIQGPFIGSFERQYEVVSRHASYASCNKERVRMVKNNQSFARFVCVEVDKD
jgi:hypothetical protein